MQKIYQPFGEQPGYEEELDDEFIETGFHKKKPGMTEPVLTGEAASLYDSFQYELQAKRIEEKLQEIDKLQQAIIREQKNRKREIRELIAWTACILVLAILLIQWIEKYSAAGFEVVMPAILGVLTAIYGIRRAVRIGTRIRDYRCRSVPGKYIRYRMQYGIKTFQEEKLELDKRRDDLLCKRKQNEAIQKKLGL